MEEELQAHRIWKLPELISDRTPKPQAIIEGGVLNSQSLLLIAGQQKAKKSFLAANLAMAIAAGRSFACFTVRRAHKVLVLSAEGGFHSNKDRIIRMAQTVHGLDDDSLHFDFGTRWKLDNEADRHELMATVEKIKPHVVVIDPLVKFHMKDENSAHEMAQVLGVIRHLIDDKKLSVILVHHMGKSINGGARGSSAIMGEYDAYIQIEKHKGRQKLEFDMRHSETPDPISVVFNSDTLWFELDERHNPLIQILQSSGPLEKKVLAGKLVEDGLYATDKSAYNRISKDIKGGLIVERENKVCLC